MTQSVVKWLGGKSAAANRILAQFPDPSSYDIYCEPCGGAMHVLMEKPRYHHTEIYNDRDNLLVNFWQEIQGNAALVRDAFMQRPYSRKLYYDYWHSLYGSKTRAMLPDPMLSTLEQAVRWFYILHGNMTGYMRESAPGWTTLHVEAAKQKALRFEEIQERIRYVAIDNREAIETIRRYAKLPGRKLFYVDPPYIGVEHYYPASRHGFDHVGLASILNSLDPEQCSVALSYYQHPLLDELYPASHWRRDSWQQLKPSAVSNNANNLIMGDEVLLMNYEPVTQSLWNEVAG